MSLSPSDIKKIAHLARLSISSDEIKPLTDDLNNILQLVEKMDKEDTTDIQPLAHPYDIEQPLRCDNVTEKDQRELFQQSAPQSHAGLYIVPKVIETE